MHPMREEVEMNKEIVKRDAIRMAAGLARGDGLSVLLGRCEKQKTVSTRIVEHDLEVVEEFMKQCAIQMRTMHDLL